MNVHISSKQVTFWRIWIRMKTFYQIAILMLAMLIIATSFNCSLISVVTVTFDSAFSVSNDDSITSAFKVENTVVITVTVDISITVSISALRIVQITSNSETESTAIMNDSDSYMTVAIINAYDNFLFFFFASNADSSFSIDNSFVTTLSDNAFTQYAFSIEWAERIYVTSNLNLDDSKIEDSYTDSSDIDVSYVDDYSIFITCFSQNIAVFDCNLDLFKQLDISCSNQVDDLVCLNSAQNIVNESTSSFFAVCAETAYIYSNDNEINVSNLKSTVISCCINTFCNASSRQLNQEKKSHDERVRVRNTIWRVQKTSAASSLRHRQHHHSPWYVIDE